MAFLIARHVKDHLDVTGLRVIQGRHQALMSHCGHLCFCRIQNAMLFMVFSLQLPNSIYLRGFYEPVSVNVMPNDRAQAFETSDFSNRYRVTASAHSLADPDESADGRSVAQPRPLQRCLPHTLFGLSACDVNPAMCLMAEEGIRALASALPAIRERSDDVDARADALYGAWLCDSVLGNVGTALRHQLYPPGRQL